MPRRPLVVLAATLLLTFTGAACGGDDDATGSDASGSETTGSTAEDAADEPSTETSGSDTTIPDASSETSAVDGGGTEAYCSFLEEVEPPPDEDKAGNLAYLEDWKAVAPDDLKDDLDVIIGYSKTVDFADDPGEPPGDVATAATAVTQYGMDTCG